MQHDGFQFPVNASGVASIFLDDVPGTFSGGRNRGYANAGDGTGHLLLPSTKSDFSFASHKNEIKNRSEDEDRKEVGHDKGNDLSHGVA